MMWKIIAIIAILVIIVIRLNSKLNKICTRMNDTIVIHKSIRDVTRLNSRIKNAYLLISNFERGFVEIFPITKYFSHWMVMLETITGEYYIVSTTSNHYVEIFEPQYNGKSKHCKYLYQDNV